MKVALLLAAPEIPTVAETGVPGYEASSWFGVLAPAGTPKDIVDKLSKEIAKSLQTADMKKKLEEQGAEAVGSTPDEFATHIKAETAKWAKVVKESGATVN